MMSQGSDIACDSSDKDIEMAHYIGTSINGKGRGIPDGNARRDDGASL